MSPRKRGRPPLDPALVAQAVELRRAGRSWSEIAEALGIARSTARRVCLNSRGPWGGDRGRP